MLLALKERWLEARIGMFSRRQEGWMPDPVFEHTALSVATLGSFDVVHVYPCDVTPSMVDLIHAGGRVAPANDAGDAAEIHSALQACADRFSTNDVELAKRTISEWQDMRTHEHVHRRTPEGRVGS